MAEPPPDPRVDAQHWPCGPGCEYARPMPGTYGEWHWCSHPSHGGHLIRDGRDCSRYRATTTLPDPNRPRHWLE